MSDHPYRIYFDRNTHDSLNSYACEVCSHVSRSKDALRKHVSYRHPGAPSPCETEAKRKRSKAAAAAKLQHELASAALMPSTSATQQQLPSPGGQFVGSVHMSLQQQLQHQSAMGFSAAAAAFSATCAQQQQTSDRAASPMVVGDPSLSTLRCSLDAAVSVSNTSTVPTMTPASTTTPVLSTATTATTTTSASPTFSAIAAPSVGGDAANRATPQTSAPASSMSTTTTLGECK